MAGALTPRQANPPGASPDSTRLRTGVHPDRESSPRRRHSCWVGHSSALPPRRTTTGRSRIAAADPRPQRRAMRDRLAA